MACRTTTTTTSSAKARPTRKRACGSRTRPSGCASPRAPTRSAPPSPGSWRQLAEWGLSYESRPDSRLDSLIGFLDAVCRPDGKTLVQRARRGLHRVRPHRRLAAARAAPSAATPTVLAVIQGSTPTEDREYIRSQFTADPAKEPVRVLLATDAAGEGIDLQTHCHRLVNFDIPFNPSRLEQRIGRIDRYGQTEEPRGVPLRPRWPTSSTYAADADFMARIATKIAQVEQDLGSVNQVIGEEIQTALRPAHTRRSARPRASTPTRSSTPRWPAEWSSTRG